MIFSLLNEISITFLGSKLLSLLPVIDVLFNKKKKEKKKKQQSVIQILEVSHLFHKVFQSKRKGSNVSAVGGQDKFDSKENVNTVQNMLSTSFRAPVHYVVKILSNY